MSYESTPQAYLRRARERLLTGHDEDLFYAALELRFCIEARQADYLEAIEWYKGQKIRPWRLGDTGKKLQGLWRSPKIASLIYDFDGTQFPTFYTPILPSLTRAGEGLGSLLHAQRQPHASKPDWISATRNKLIGIYRDAWLACRGEHIAPPLMDNDTHEVHPFKLYANPETADLIVRLLRAMPMGNFTLIVDYLDQPPLEWVCDL